MSKRTQRDYPGKEEAKYGGNNKRQKLGSLPEKNLKEPIKQNFLPPQEYQNFLNNYLVNKGKMGNRKLTQADVNEWPYRYDPISAQSNIINEIAGDFNRNNKFGIGKVNKLEGEYENDMGGYSMSMDLEKPPKDDRMPKGDYSFFTIPKKTSANYPPDPFTIAHELVHANDHQNHNLNSKVWKDLKILYKELGKDDRVFDEAIIDIQKTIDPTGGFAAGAYTPDEIKKTSLDDINRWRREISKQDELSSSSLPDWQTIFKEIKPLLTQQTPFGNPIIDNYHFLLTKGSEFPAHAVQNLHNSWKANEEIPSVRAALNEPSKRFLGSMLGHMGNAYSSDNAPVTNNYIRQRRNSLGLADILQDQPNQNHPLGLGSMMTQPNLQQNQQQDMRSRDYQAPNQPLGLGTTLSQQHDPFSQGMGGFGGGMQPTMSSQGLNQFQQNPQYQSSLGNIMDQQQNPYSTMGGMNFSNQYIPDKETLAINQRFGGLDDEDILPSQQQDSTSSLDMIQPRQGQNPSQQNQDNFARGGSVTRVKQRESNFDMQRAMQILQLLTRGMA